MENQVRLFEKFDKVHRKAFDCGDKNRNEFLRRHASRYHENWFSRTYVIADERRIAGYHTITATSAAKAELNIRRGPDHMGLPALLLIQLGVDATEQGMGYGERLIHHVFTVASQMAKSVGCVAVLVDAANSAVGLYERYGFERYERVGQQGMAGFVPMFIKTKTILAALAVLETTTE